MSQERFPLVNPYLGRNAAAYVAECVDTRWISSKGHFIGAFEEAFARYVGTKRAVAVSNGTVALHLALVGLGVGPGDEVIVPDLTFAATINAVIHAGATPVIVDVDRLSWNISSEAIEAAVSPRTKVVIPVHLYGMPCAMDEILRIAAKHGIAVLEDCAEAHGASIGGRVVGSLGDCGAFSFFGNKIITTGEGGMITVSDDSVYERILRVRDHGMSTEKRYFHDVVGYNGRMTNLQAALGLAQLEEIEEILARRDTIDTWYRKCLGHVPGVELAVPTAGCRQVNWLFTCLVARRDELVQALMRANVESRLAFFPLHRMPIYQAYGSGNFPCTDEIAAKGISLPTFLSMKEEDVDRICTAMSGICDG